MNTLYNHLLPSQLISFSHTKGNKVIKFVQLIVIEFRFSYPNCLTPMLYLTIVPWVISGSGSSHITCTSQ